MIAAWVIKKLSENGISVQPLPADKDTYNANSDAWLGPDYDGVNGTAGFDIVISETWGPNYDPSTKLFDMTYEWGTGEPDAAVTSKMTDPSKNDFTKMVLDATKTKDVAARKKLYQDILTGLHKNALFLPLTAKRNLAVLNKRVSGFRFGHTQYDFPVAHLYPTGAKGKNNIVKMAVSLPMVPIACMINEKQY
jgi:ABC-type transport system substrate-binding protein